MSNADQTDRAAQGICPVCLLNPTAIACNMPECPTPYVRPSGFWSWIVRRFGGVHDLTRLSLVIHDRGVHLSWVRDQVERWRIGT